MERKEKQTKFLGGITGKLLLATLVLMQSQALSGYNRADFGLLIDWAGSNSLFRRYKVFPEGYGGDLSGANLSNLNLSHVKLCGMNLSGANLSGADLTSADLSGADLSDANLQAADLFLTKFCGANLSGANVTGARSFPMKTKRIRSLNIFNAQGFSQVGRQRLLDNGAIEEAPPEEELERNADELELRRLREQLVHVQRERRDDALGL
ncbi:pentapeptide repeat-containing protein, partial [Candidatus Babeliales bacterium]|nr:pentapeptide repeat-containing protein [Candidatus Babeliales bacterium]